MQYYYITTELLYVIIRFLHRVSGLTLWDQVKSADIRESGDASPTRKIVTVLIWTCDTNVPGKNSQKTALFNTDWSKA